MNTKLHMVRVWLCPNCRAVLERTKQSYSPMWLCPNRIEATHAQPPRLYTPAQLLAGGHWRREGRAV